MLSQFSINSSLHEGNLLSKKGSKRASVVCYRCHEKKIKCDLQKSAGERGMLCTNCRDAGVPCRLRQSRRGGAKRRADTVPAGDVDEHLFPMEVDEPDDSLQANVAFDQQLVGTGFDAQVLMPFNEQPKNSVSVKNPTSHEQAEGPSATSPSHPGYLGDSGYMQIFGHESGGDSPIALQTAQKERRPIDDIPPALHEAHLEVFYELALTWCPVLDKETYYSSPGFNQSLLLRHSLALCGNQIRPALIEQASSSEYYERAKELFYKNQERNPLVRIISLMLFYWYSAEAPNIVSTDNSWWWTGSAIRLAQQMGLHRQSEVSTPLCEGDSPGLRRRIWWTLMTRERISAISQGRPCIADPKDCSVPMPTKEDFPDPEDIRTSIFLAWLRLCDIVAEIGIHIRRQTPFSAVAFARELISWIECLPRTLRPSIGEAGTKGFHRDVHGMHLTYLSTITLMHLSKVSKALPQASTAAIIAASCTSRIFRDYLLRGSLRFLAGQAGWYITIAVLALIHARRVPGLQEAADHDIKLLRSAIKEMARLWPSSKMFENGINKFFDADPTYQDSTLSGSTSSLNDYSSLGADDVIDWRSYFPDISSETSPLVSILLVNSPTRTVPQAELNFDFPTQLNDFLFDPDLFSGDFLET